jgi:hypothetical protein
MVHDTQHPNPRTDAPLRTVRLLHDLRNALAGLKLDVSLLADDITASHVDRARIRDYAEDLQEAIVLTNQLTTELGVPGPSPETLDPNDVLDGIVEMVDRTLPFSCPVELEMEAAVWPVKVDPRILHRTLVNLVTRARDSAVGGGMLHLASRNRTIGRAAAVEISPDMTPGRYVELAVGSLCGSTFDDILRDVGSLDDMGGFSRIHHGPMMTTFEIYLPAGIDAINDPRCPDATVPLGMRPRV